MKKNLFFIFLHFLCFSLFAATVDSLEIATAMNKNYKVAIVLPNSYTKNKANYPVMYLLHGAWGHYNDWLTKTPDKMLIQNLADQYNLIIVTPEGETFGWYMDSPLNPSNKFETHIIKEVIPKIDNTYRTVKDKKGRVITGLSMGGHGAMYLSTRHPEIFSAVGAMSGVLDMSNTQGSANADFAKVLKGLFEKYIGTSDTTNDIFINNSVINFLPAIKKNAMPTIIDCGVDDFLIEMNREMHRRLVYAKVEHDYTERPGGHTWDYWQNSLPYHVMFFQKVLKKNGVTVD
jgi:putative tributyrin esterase